MQTEEGRASIDSVVLFISNRASIKASAARIGINPNTLTRWIMRGKQEEEGVYRELFDRIVVALGQATAECEVELSNMKPEFYLKHGPGRILLGNVYNTNTEDPTTVFGLDGSISSGGEINPTGIQDETDIVLPANEQSRTDEQDNSMTLEALAALRESGYDINAMIDETIAKNKTKTIENISE